MTGQVELPHIAVSLTWSAPILPSPGTDKQKQDPSSPWFLPCDVLQLQWELVQSADAWAPLRVLTQGACG